jgi:hypothetical protein
MNVAFNHAQSMLQGSMEVMRDVAPRIARGNPGELAQDMVTLGQQKHTVRAAATLIRVADEMQGTLLDMLA